MTQAFASQNLRTGGLTRDRIEVYPHGMDTHRIEKLHGEGRYGYRGWVITREERDWDARGLGGNGWAGPKVSWRVRKSSARVGTVEAQRSQRIGFDTRRAAVAYIDQQEAS